ncbi:hypothetical protein K435DRAFT_970165 [Dendrothele bispora CBS 962.96]|uniref:Cytosolic endo-beta-N-acetylglucosaminidase TIM barrel domain-containing protein n=1 Tax=Dendrothele bispora (strain CBS 962.96) TaxID=1314807 RepID=A0A4S8LCV5_DENBC|nr:hypothetical protein K435DRAFT_970165 [Dendrothele bispora CBS 962.96]
MPFRYYNKSHYTLPKYAYFESLEELDEWSKNISRFRPFEDVLPYRPRSISVLDDEIDHRSPGSKGKLLVCHDYKGGYTESPFELAYTFQYWHTCDVFIYFSHHRVTVPPPGWTTAAHRQGVKMLGTLIFEHDEAKPDCLRLLVGQLPKSPTGPASPIQSSPTSSLSLPLSPHYARLLAQLAAQRGFDGYLLNFECPLLQGGVEQTRVLAAWITLLKKELRDKVGMHAEVVWYDSVIFTGHLAWQDRLNSLNLPFFLSSDSIFTNYTWRPTYPNLTAQYFLSLSSALTANKTLRDIYMGIDVWGRGSHGAGSFGSYRALQHISPSSLGLSVAIFGQAWTWESEQDKDEWTWEKWWDYERLLWAGPRTVIPKSKGIVSETESLPTRDKSSGRKDEEDEEETIPIPEMPRPEGTLPCECTSTPYKALSTFFTRKVPPNPAKGIPFHTTFCPGAGRGWWVDGRKVYDVFEASENRDKATEKFRGWTDVHKQTSMGDLLWPSPRVVDTTPGVDDDEGVKETGMKSRSKVVMDQAWNGGSSVRVLTVLSLDDGKRDQAETEEEEESILQFRSFRLPVQSLGVSRGRVYETRVVYKLETGGEEEADEVEKDVGISVARLGSNYEDGIKTFAVPTTNESGLDSQANGWTKLAIRFVVDDADAGASINEEKDTLISLGLSVSVIVSSSASKSVRIPILLGQINVYALPTSTTT